MCLADKLNYLTGNLLGSFHGSSFKFSQEPTSGILSFEIFVLAISAFTLFLSYRQDKNTFKKYGIVALGVLIFEFFVQPLWNNFDLSWWAYIYRDVSWILTLGWSTILFASLKLVELYVKHKKETVKFLYTLVISAIAGFIGESVVLSLGIRSYAPEVLERISGIKLPLLQTPIEALYYMPVFMILILSFYKYWELVLNGVNLIPVKKQSWFRNLIISIVGVFLYEVMIEAMVENAGLPSWSYVFYDISFLITLSWVIIIWIAVSIVDRLTVLYVNYFEKFLWYLLTITIITIPLESLLVTNKIRVYGPSLVENFVGYMIPFTNLAVEIAFAIPLFLALVIGFIKFWSYVFDNKL